jgi:hypothetical protein
MSDCPEDAFSRLRKKRPQSEKESEETGLLRKSSVNKFFDIAAPQLIVRFTPAPIPDVDLSGEQFRVQEQSREAELVLGQLGEDVGRLESGFPGVERAIGNVGGQASEAQGKAEMLHGQLRQINRICQELRKENEEARMLIVQWVVQFVTWVIYVFGEGRRFIGGPRAFLRGDREAGK